MNVFNVILLILYFHLLIMKKRNKKKRSVLDYESVDFGLGSERSSVEIDEVLYGENSE